MKARWRSSRGQIIIPAAFFFPTLFLFVFLLFETAKLSREKIRHQFAADAAVFVEMTNYSDFLNRSAYVNGPFPMRIFYEGFHGTPMPCVNGTSSNCPNDTTLDDLLYRDGDFPSVPQGNGSPGDPDQFNTGAASLPTWPIVYGQAERNGTMGASPDPESQTCTITTGSGHSAPSCVTIISEHTAQFYPMDWDTANSVYRLYVQIFTLLGSVESAQFQVLRRLTLEGKKHNFLQKSYWLNVGGDDAITEASTAAQNFSNGDDDKFAQGGGAVKFHCVDNVLFYGMTVTPNGLFQKTFLVASDPIPHMVASNEPGCSLFQVVEVDPNALSGMKWGNGWTGTFEWNPPSSNYFNVALKGLATNAGPSGNPVVQATGVIDGFGGAQPSVWPNPTPKFQVRTLP